MFQKFLQDYAARIRDKSDSEKVRLYIDWCHENNVEATILRLSSEKKGGWSRNYSLDFTTSRVIVTKKSLATNFVDLGFVAGLAPYPSLLIAGKDPTTKIKKQASRTPAEMANDENAYFIWYSDIDRLGFRKGLETTVTNMFGQAIVSNFLSIWTKDGNRLDFTLPVSKNGIYQQIHFWLSVAVPPNCQPA
nr:hypothetical protein [uncultured Nitrososphaera sp.]